MSHTACPRSRVLRSLTVLLPRVLTLAVCCPWATDLSAATGYLNRAYNDPASQRVAPDYHRTQPRERHVDSTSHHTPSAPEGVRYIHVTMTPGKQARLEKIRRNSHDLPAPKFKKLIDGKHPAVVRISVEGEGNVLYHGSGTLIAASAEKGIVITNWHVIRDRAGAISVKFPDGFVAKAKVLKIDKIWDLAALSIARPRAKPVKLSDKIPKIGDVLTIAGWASGTYRHSTGRMLQFCAPGMTEPAEILEITTAARNGDSGGPIFAQDGTLAGVLFGSASGTTNGSHAGRVRHFLQPVIAQVASAAESQEDVRPASYVE